MNSSQGQSSNTSARTFSFIKNVVAAFNTTALFNVVQVLPQNQNHQNELRLLHEKLQARATTSASTAETRPVTILVGLQHVNRPPAYAMVTCDAPITLNVDDLMVIVLTDIQTQRVSHALLTSFVSGTNYEIIRAGEAREVEKLDHWRDGCHVLDTLAAFID